MNSDLFEKLTQEQIKAVKTKNRYALINSGAGTGKTLTAACRYAYLVGECDIPSESILFLLFSDKAVCDMKSFLSAYLTPADMKYITTFNGLCLKILEEEHRFFDLPKNFRVISSEEQSDILKLIIKEKHIDLKKCPFEKMIKILTDYKASCPYCAHLINDSTHHLAGKYLNAADIYDTVIFGYLYNQKRSAALDETDLLRLTLYALENIAPLKIKWSNKFRYIIADEFQEIGEPQSRLLQGLMSGAESFFAAGDPEQLLYEDRGAQKRFIESFDTIFPRASLYTFGKNFRSSANIVNAASDLIAKNGDVPENRFTAAGERGAPVSYSHFKTAHEEYSRLCGEIHSLIKKGTAPCSIAVLVRSRSLIDEIKQELYKNNIPCIAADSGNILRDKTAADIIAYLQMTVYQDDISFRRIINVPGRYLGEKRIAVLNEYAAEKNCSLYQALKEKVRQRDKNFVRTGAEKFIGLIDKFSEIYNTLTVSELVSRMIEESGYCEFIQKENDTSAIEALHKLQELTARWEDRTLKELLTHIALYSDEDIPDGNKVKLMTVRSAKGKSFPYVFVCGLNEGIFPAGSARKYSDMKAERRLAYTAFTRAEKALYLTEAEIRGDDSKTLYPSRFILEINRFFLNYSTAPDEQLLKEAMGYIRGSENSLRSAHRKNLREYEKTGFKTGNKIDHRIFGRGTVINITEGSYIIKFDGIRYPKEIKFSEMNEVK